MSNNNRLPSLDRLQAKIDAIKKSRNSADKNNYGSDMSQATRLVTDLSAGAIVGGVFGYFVDKGFDTLPLFMIIGLFLGIAAGVKNMLHSAEIIDKELEQNDIKEHIKDDSTI